jgi:hypothetical protein
VAFREEGLGGRQKGQPTDRQTTRSSIEADQLPGIA